MFFSFSFIFFIFINYNKMSSLWGPKYWKFFHTLSTLYPNNPTIYDKSLALTLISTIDRVLPCPKCARHFRQNLKEITIRNALNSKIDFIKWFIDLHNMVNFELKKKMVTYKIIDRLKIYNKSDILQQYSDVKEFMKYVFPENKNPQLGHIRAVKRFWKAVDKFILYYK